MKKLFCLLALPSLFVVSNARADTLLYQITGDEGLIASFEIDSRPEPDLIGYHNQFFKLKGVAGVYPGNPPVGSVDISFYARSVDNGMAINQVIDESHIEPLFDGYGPRLYTGPVTKPRMKVGSFDFEDSDYHLTVTRVSAVPEPASAALMLTGGLALAGIATARRRAASGASA